MCVLFLFSGTSNCNQVSWGIWSEGPPLVQGLEATRKEKFNVIYERNTAAIAAVFVAAVDQRGIHTQIYFSSSFRETSNTLRDLVRLWCKWANGPSSPFFSLLLSLVQSRSQMQNAKRIRRKKKKDGITRCGVLVVFLLLFRFVDSCPQLQSSRVVIRI